MHLRRGCPGPPDEFDRLTYELGQLALPENDTIAPPRQRDPAAILNWLADAELRVARAIEFAHLAVMVTGDHRAYSHRLGTIDSVRASLAELKDEIWPVLEDAVAELDAPPLGPWHAPPRFMGGAR